MHRVVVRRHVSDHADAGLTTRSQRAPTGALDILFLELPAAFSPRGGELLLGTVEPRWWASAWLGAVQGLARRLVQQGNERRAVGHVGFGEDVLDVGFDGGEADAQPESDLVVREAFGYEQCDVALA